jgi:hypothetical protein
MDLLLFIVILVLLFGGRATWLAVVTSKTFVSPRYFDTSKN